MLFYTEAVLKFLKLDTQAQQCEAVVQGRSLLPIPASVYSSRVGFGFATLFVIFTVLLTISVAKISLGDDPTTTPTSTTSPPPNNTTTEPTTNQSPNNNDNNKINTDNVVPKENIIYVPYEKFDRSFGIKEGGVFVSYTEYKQLLESARQKQEPQKTSEVPIAAMITEMEGTAKVSDDIVQVESSLEIELLKDGWHEIPIRLGDTAITKAEINGEPAKISGNPQTGYKLVVEKKKNETNTQRFKLTLNFAKGIAKLPGRNSVSFQIPQTPLSRWTVIIPESDVKIDFSPSIAAADKKENNSKQTTLHAFVGTVPEVQITWTPKSEGATGLEALISTQILQQTIIDEGIYRTTAEFEYNISRASVANLAINVPKDQKVVRVIDSNIKKWEVETKDNIQTIKIELFEPAKDRQLVRFDLEKLFDTKKQQDDKNNSTTPVNIKIPELAAVGVGRQQGILTIRATNELICETIDTAGLLRIDFAELPKQLQNNQWDAAYRISSTSYNLAVAVNKVKPRINVTSQAAINLNQGLYLENLLVFKIEQAGLFQIQLQVPAMFANYSVRQFNGNNITGANIDSFTLAPINGNDKFKLMTIKLSKKAIGNVGLKIEGFHRVDNIESKKSGESFELPVLLPTMLPDFAEQFAGKLLLRVDDSFRINPIEAEGVQPVSIQQIIDQEWLIAKGQAQSGFLFSQDIVALKIKAEKRQPQLTLKEIRHVRVESGAIKHKVTFDYNVLFSGLNSIRIDLPEQISGRISLDRMNRNGINNDWRDTRIVPQPDDVEKGYVAWEFSCGSKIRGKGKLSFSWDDVIAQPAIGQSIDISIAKLTPHKQQPADRIWGQIIVSKSESIDLGESDKSNGLKPIDPKNDVEAADRVEDAVAAFEFYDTWQLELAATRYKLEEVKRTSIEKGIIRANLFLSKNGTGISAQGLFKIRSVQQRLEMTFEQSAKISEVRINNKRVPLEADSTAKYMIPLTSITPDTPFLLDIRYTIEPPSKNKILIPTFSTSDQEPNKMSNTAIQKAELSVFVPDDFLVVAYDGNWTKDFLYKKSEYGNRNSLIRYKNIQSEVQTLYNGFGIQHDDFQIAGNEHPFSAIHPDNDTALKIQIVSTKLASIIFIVMVLYGLLTIRITFVKWVQITLAIIIVCIFTGFIATTLTEYLITNSAVCWGIAVILSCRVLKGLFSLRKIKRKITEPQPEQTTNTNGNVTTNNEEGGQNNEN
jgi:hypothetical protein